MNPKPQISSRRGVALVVVLAFVVLLTGLVLAYFTQSMLSRKMSDSSLGDSRTRQLAQSALDVIVADLKQEIANGSTTNTYGTNTVYTPTNNFNAVPMRSGNPPLVGGVDPIPNLIRRSMSGDTNNAFPRVPSRASAVSSTNVSRNGRFISPARWNSHYLIPRSDMGTNADTTPNASANFTPPDWIFVTANGPEILTAPSTSVIGRYAYAIYDEGGLLDMNVAGYTSSTPPSATPHPAPNPLNLQNWGYADKASLAFADLTVLDLTQDQVDQIVGWRNYATAQPAGSFGSFTFNSQAALRYHDFVLGNTNGFLTVPAATWSGGGLSGTDQTFTSRQALLQMQKTLDFPQDALQFMGTFSRDLEQPTVSPSKDLPLVRSGPTTDANIWGTGNDSYQKDRYSGATQKSPYDINPELLSVRVLQPFTRPDGSTANIGDPLVNKRFPLSRLGQILRTATASKSDSDPIYRNFGLYRSSASDPWSYDHGDSSGILRLSHPGTGGTPTGVAQRNREPDFFELLKAGINVGSVGKGGLASGATTAGSMNYLQQQLDTVSALQILQIGANIIDQYDGDGYPTRIAFAGTPDKEVRGIEDLPYIESVRHRLIFKTSTVGNWLIQPMLWNPHDPNAPQPTGYAANSPKHFRILASNPDDDPIHAAEFVLTNFSGDNQWGVNDLDFNANPPLGEPLTFNAGESNGFYGFRQPTLLGEANTPSGTNANGNNMTQADADTGITFIGVQAASNFPLKLPKKSDPTKFDRILKVNWGLHYDNALGDVPGNPSGLTKEGIAFSVECRDEETNAWIPYDSFNFKPDGSGISFFSTGVNSDSAASAWIQANFATTAAGVKAIDRPRNNPGDPNDPASFHKNDMRLGGSTRTDPRTSRWGNDVGQYLALRPGIDRPNNIYESVRGGTGIGFGEHVGVGNASRPDNGFSPGGEYSSPTQTWWRGYQHAYFAENSIRDTRQAATENPLRLKRYNRDPDGVIRRAMAGYSTDPGSGGDFDKLEGLPLANNNFASRPIILNRPFKTVSELGHVFRGSPWKNLDFSFPESGDSALLDLFCINEPAPDGLVAGRINLNSRQPGALQAVFAGANTDPANPTNQLSSTAAAELAQKLAERNTDTNAANRRGPVTSRAGLVGTWNPDPTKNLTNSAHLDPEFYYSGFTSDIGTVSSLIGTSTALIPRQRESAIRALGDVGTARTWNLMIDVVAQSGKFSPNATSLTQFTVEGEKRFWLHIAIDRYTGKVLDQQLEQISE